MSNNSDTTLQIGTVINNKWEILEFIAKGGMAEVYRARQIKLDREVAVKILSHEFLASFEGDEEEINVAHERFEREVKAMAQVRHLNVLQIYDNDRAIIKGNGEELSIEYIAMEYIPGPSLRSTLLPEGFQTNEKEVRKWIRNYFLPILDGVESVHTVGIVHRDLKPENVLLDDNIPKISDFGLAGGARWKSVTQDHHVSGTVPYQAHEQFIDMGETDARADIYSLGKMLYELVTGKMDEKPALFWKTVRLSNPDTRFFKRLDRVIQQATAEDRNQRTPSVKLLREAIIEVLEDEGESAGVSGRSYVKVFGIKRSILLMMILIIVAGGSIGFHLFYHSEKTPLPSIESPLRENAQARVSDLPRNKSVPPSSTPGTFKAKDGATLRLVPEGELVLPERFGDHAGKPARIKSFYMDETEVTNHQYAEFLNKVLSRIRVDGGVVKGDGNVWLLLGEVTKGYEPIVLRDGRFSVKDPVFHSHPVVRVTAYGAAAYARFFGRRLPKETEWLYAAKGNNDKGIKPPAHLPESSGQMDMETMHREMSTPASERKESPQRPLPVIQAKPNNYGIRGLAENVSEWSLRFQMGSSNEKGEPQYLILPSAISRQPWEAFEEVGFRTALSVPSKQ